MRYPDEVIEELRNRSDIVSVISQVVHLEKKGSRYFGLCPFHNEKSGSFCVTPERQMYHCFGCGVSGNVFSFVMNYENMTFTEAVQSLAESAGMTLPEPEYTPGARKEADKKARMLEMYREAATYYYKQLRSPIGARALEYFTHRGLTPETMRRFGLGYSPQSPAPLYTLLKSKGFTDELIRESQLMKVDERGGWDRFYNRAMFPIMDTRNRVIGFGGRVMGEGEPKYLNSPESPIFDKSRNLFGLNLAKSSRRGYFLLCEGYMDVISLHQAGFDCAVASLGTSLTSGQAGLIGHFTREVIITYDSDGAGQKAALRAIPILKAAGIRTRILNMKPHKDPDEFMVHLGAEAYEQRIKEALPSFYFETDVMASQYDMTDPEQKTDFHKSIARKLAAFTDSLERENYLTAVSARYTIPADYLREMVNYIGGMAEPEDASAPRETALFNRKKEKGQGLLAAERRVLSWISTTDADIHKIAEIIYPECFDDEIIRGVAEFIFDARLSGRRADAASIVDRFSDDSEVREKVSAVFMADLPEDEEEAAEVLLMSLRQVKSEYLRRAFSSMDEHTDMQRLTLEKAQIDKLRITDITGHK